MVSNCLIDAPHEIGRAYKHIGRNDEKGQLRLLDTDS